MDMPKRQQGTSWSRLANAGGVMIRRYLSLGEISTELGVSQRTLRFWIADGKLPGAAKFGRSWRIEVDAYEHWKAEASSSAKSAPRESWVFPTRLATSSELRQRLAELSHEPAREGTALERRFLLSSIKRAEKEEQGRLSGQRERWSSDTPKDV
jgi:excisionase family DNA binding protein